MAYNDPVVVNTWDKTIAVLDPNSDYPKYIPNPNYIDRMAGTQLSSADTTFRQKLAAGTITPMYHQMQESTGSGGGVNYVNDPSKFYGYQEITSGGKVLSYDGTGKLVSTTDARTGGDAFGGFFSGLGTAASNVVSGVSDGISSAGSMVAKSPEAMAIITAIAAANGVDPATTATILGANRAGQDGNIRAGLETAALSYAGGKMAAPSTGAITAPVSGGTTGGWTQLGGSGGGLIQSGPFAGATAAELQAANAGGGLLSSGGAAAGTAAAGTAAGTTAAGTAATGGAMSGIKGILNTAKDYAPLIGAVAGAAASGDTKTSTTADKSPWAPAQEWMKANLGLGQQLQAQYAANPFSQFQKQAYNNSAQLGNQFRSNLNGLIPQMNSFRPYQRTPQSQTVAPMQFAPANLGLTTNPFSGV